MHGFRFWVLLPILAEIFIPDIPIPNLGRIDYITMPPLSTNRDNPISIGAYLGNDNDYFLKITYQHINDAEPTELVRMNGNSSRIDKVIYFPKEKVTSGKINITIYIACSSFKNGSVTTVIEASKIIPSNVALTSNFVTSFTTDTNYYSYQFSDGGKAKYYAERYRFFEFQREQEQNYYNYLDFDRIYFGYNCAPGVSFEYQDCFAYLQNYNHWFDNVGTPFGNFRKIPLTIVKKDEQYHFELTDIIYVDKTTNQLFSEPKENAFATKKLFLPKNGYTKDNIQMNLNIKGAGANEISISQTFLFSFNSNYFGDCYNSEYCISSTQTETNFEYGEIEEH